MNHNYENNPPIGIDFGTSNSAIACFVNTNRMHGSQVYYLNNYGSKSDPYLLQSSIYLQENSETDHEILIGEAAENKWRHDPTNYVRAIKREIGAIDKTYDLGGKIYSPVELSSEIIKTLFKDPITQGTDFCPSGIVITVPYYYKQPQNDNTLLALNKAIDYTFSKESKKPKVLGLVPEPIAASLHYVNSLVDTTIHERNTLVFDLGGGTLDITLFKIIVQAQKLHFEVLASDGHSSFGGEDFDNVLLDYIVNEEGISFENLNEKDRRFEEKTIRDAVKDAKERLSFSNEVSVFAGNLFGNEPIDTSLKRTTFEQLLAGNNGLQRNFGKELLEAVTKSLVKGSVQKDDIDLILLIGGSSQIPYFQTLLKNTFKNAQFEIQQDFLKYAVAKGAALYAAHLLDKDHGHDHQALGKGVSYEDSKIIFRTSHAMGIEKQQGQLSVIIPENTVVPAKNSKTFIPTAYSDASRQTVKLDCIKICQGSTKDIENLTPLGFVEKLPTIYTHGRGLDEIKIEINFEATETQLFAQITIPKSDKNGEDISLHTNISTISN
ncbi:Hsp70 family protein [Aureisphaera galaxeae]|uniref:Hsp70 family protein n=1 Tax=Aureisphaera galaxeae TaxID=1538023 RepID=UPI00235025FE|nr:Hsp70 family protein [Aureisphaera galaxeae]MDC8003097.1 Hsp70 family protein [Aureisphaera galaxeae]